LFDQIKTPASQAFVDDLIKGQIPEHFPYTGRDLMHGFGSDVELILEAFALKEIANHYGMWVIVDRTWTADLARWIGERKVLEIMAGVGWLAQALSEHGINIDATDDFSWSVPADCIEGRDFSPVYPSLRHQSAVEAVQASDADILLIAWPPADADAIIEAVCDAWGTGRPVLYIGETPGSINSCKALFTRYQTQPIEVLVPRHIGMRDRLFLFT
jgi:hypothetical protein